MAGPMEPEFDDSPIPPAGPDKESRTWAMVVHLSGFAGYFIPIAGNILAPLIIWQMKKEDPFVDDQGKEALNFQITATLAYLVGGLTACLGIGLIIMLVVVAAVIVLMILAALQANNGVAYRYPFSLRLIK